jgi:hypothetical protein
VGQRVATVQKLEVNVEIQRLEEQLDSFKAAERREALAALWTLVQSGAIVLPKRGSAVNLHSHTFFSYNAYGYSPSKFAWLARKAGLAVAGIVDFDVLDGLDEFTAAGRLIGLNTCVSLESRVYVPEFATRVINSPGEPGISYHMGVGFPHALKHPFLNDMRKRAARRNRDLVARVNAFTAPVSLDYDRDVLPFTPNGNVTERHLCEAYAKKRDKAFWREKLGKGTDDPAELQVLIRARTMKKGGTGYMPADKGAFPLMADMNRFALEAGAIPTLTWLDGTSEGEQSIEELFDVAMAAGAAALNIIPDRNYTPGIKDQKFKNLRDVIALAEQRRLPIIVGTEMNAPGNKFVDDFATDELAPFWPHFLNGAFIAYAHTVLQRHWGMGYLSRWAKDNFREVKGKNEFFTLLGARLDPSQEENIRCGNETHTPSQILDLVKAIQ